MAEEPVLGTIQLRRHDRPLAPVPHLGERRGRREEVVAADRETTGRVRTRDVEQRVAATGVRAGDDRPRGTVPVLDQRWGRSVRVDCEPTAKQLDALGHETPLSPPPTSSVGVEPTDHLVPFQCTTSGPDPELPTAKQLVGVEHATLLNAFPNPKLGVGFGLGTIDQVPFHRSINVFPVDPSFPIAKQLVGLADATSTSSWSTECTSFGPPAGVHDTPSQCTIRSIPTAEQDVVLAQPTPTSELAYCGGRFGLATTDQLVPSHCSINVCDPNDPEGRYEPTAKQLVTPEHETAFEGTRGRAGRSRNRNPGPTRAVPLLDEGTGRSGPDREQGRARAGRRADGDVQGPGPVRTRDDRQRGRRARRGSVRQNHTARERHRQACPAPTAPAWSACHPHRPRSVPTQIATDVARRRNAHAEGPRGAYAVFRCALPGIRGFGGACDTYQLLWVASVHYRSRFGESRCLGGP